MLMPHARTVFFGVPVKLLPDPQKKRRADIVTFGASVIDKEVKKPTTDWIDLYVPEGRRKGSENTIVKKPVAGSGLDWRQIIPQRVTPAAAAASFDIDSNLSEPKWANLAHQQNGPLWNKLKRANDQKMLFNLMMPMLRINSVCRTNPEVDAEKDIRDFCIKWLDNMGVKRFQTLSSKHLYSQLEALPDEKKKDAYYLQDKVGNLLIILPSNLNLPKGEVPPELMYTAHMDTVPNFVKPIKPVVWVDKNGYLIVEAGNGSILGGDCKAAIATFFMDIAKKLHTGEKHPTLFYLLTVDEEGSFIGSQGFNKSWVANRDKDGRRVNALIAFDHAGMPGIEVYNESPFLCRSSIRLHANGDTRALPELRDPTAVSVQVKGECAHATTMAQGRGRSAIHTLALALNKFLPTLEEFPGVRMEIQQIEGGGKAHSAVAKDASALVVFDVKPEINIAEAQGNVNRAILSFRDTLNSVSSDEEMPENAIDINMFRPLDKFPLATLIAQHVPNIGNPTLRDFVVKELIKVLSPLKSPSERTERDAASRFAVYTLARVNQGYNQDTKQTQNQIAFYDEENGDLHIGFDLRGRTYEVKAEKAKLAATLKQAEQDIPNITVSTPAHRDSPEVLTSGTSNVTALYRAICQQLFSLKDAPELWRTFGLSDLTHLAKALKHYPDSGAYEQSIGYRNHHIPGNGERDEQGFSKGEYVHLGETLVAYDLMQRLSQRFATSRNEQKLFKPRNPFERNSLNKARKQELNQ